jgi:hypothetical protein
LVVGKINQLQLGIAPMGTSVTVIASAVLLTLSLGVAHAADAPSTNPPTGAAVVTPGSETKGNPIPVPNQAPGTTIDKGGNPSATTPAEENPKTPE